mmetsp:Transcript_21471/g.59634  ORF Transcript_21471/g.59634 Transcript_21471/m.59634 type:complete len:465 (-) Transcript_21471:122-1516(-)
MTMNPNLQASGHAVTSVMAPPLGTAAARCSAAHAHHAFNTTAGKHSVARGQHNGPHVRVHAEVAAGAAGTAAPQTVQSALGALPVHITAVLDSGNIETHETSQDGLTHRLRIKPDPFTVGTDNKAHMQWFHFRACNVQGKPLTFCITNCGECSFPEAWDGYQTVASYDCKTWFRVTSTTYSEGCLEWSITPEKDTIWLAYFAPFSYERHQDLISRCSMHPAAQLSVLGTTLDGRPLEMLTIGTGERNVWLIARQHPGEPMAEWLAEGFLDRLLDSEDAQKAATFHVVPNMNPDGSVRGHLRTNAGGANLNREWASTGSYEAPTLSRSPEVYHVLAAMDKIGVDLFLDVHGDEALPANFWAGFEGIPDVSPRLLELYELYKGDMLASSPDFQTEMGYPVDEPGKANLAICSNQVAHRFGCVALTFEQPFKDCWNSPDPVHGWSPQRAIQLGKSTLEATIEFLPKL